MTSNLELSHDWLIELPLYTTIIFSSKSSSYFWAKTISKIGVLNLVIDNVSFSLSALSDSRQLRGILPGHMADMQVALKFCAKQHNQTSSTWAASGLWSSNWVMTILPGMLCFGILSAIDGTHLCCAVVFAWAKHSLNRLIMQSAQFSCHLREKLVTTTHWKTHKKLCLEGDVEWLLSFVCPLHACRW